ncbi:hypothetical protein KY495_23360 [Massilia sp. PAMC28688]|uniref:hypothetical protein n=1 Tax=Massilia sp. PAMC28688 TaxID=2861283 RepID=UPI001C626D1E|nr:hypothetical protein [Massilia sp. PAMC28688]QYF93559.1 hypothetical protein KY495_23360 [Massilia sp. PAMC28688]
MPRSLSLRQRLSMCGEGWLAVVIPFVVGLGLSLAFMAGADFTEWEFRDDDPAAMGQLVELNLVRRKTRYYYELKYRYVVDGVLYENVAVTKTQAEEPDPATPLRVQYVPGHPEWSRIPGLRKTHIPNWLWLVGLFPILIGVVAAVFYVRAVLASWRVVRYGIVTKARSSRRPLPGLGRRGKPLSQVILTFQAFDGQEYELHLGPVGNFNQGESTRVVYLAHAPSTVQRYDSLPKPVKTLLSAQPA